MSLCISPEIGSASIEGWIDLNGPKGPNVLNKDLRSFTINVSGDSTALNTNTQKVHVYCDDHPNEEICKNTSSGGGETPCQAGGSDYYTYSCCYNRLGSKCANYAAGTGTLTSAEKSDCDACCADATWYNSFNTSYCGGGNACGNTPSVAKVSKECCIYWQETTKNLSSYPEAANACCNNKDFYYYGYSSGSSKYCKSSTENCSLSWNVSISTTGYRITGKYSISSDPTYSRSSDDSAWASLTIPIKCTLANNGYQSIFAETQDIYNGTHGYIYDPSRYGNPSYGNNGYGGNYFLDCRIEPVDGCTVMAKGRSSLGTGIGSNGEVISNNCNGSYSAPCKESGTVYSYKF